MYLTHQRNIYIDGIEIVQWTLLCITAMTAGSFVAEYNTKLGYMVIAYLLFLSFEWLMLKGLIKEAK